MNKFKAALVIGFTIGIFNHSIAAAHSGLISSNPRAGSVLNKLPVKINLKFNGNLISVGEKEINRLSVIGPNGECSLGEPKVSGRQISLATKNSSESGTYTVKWRVVSEDGHPISGAFKFTVR